MIGAYILDDDGNPVAEPDPIRWAKWFGKADRQIGCDEIGGVCISTVFLALDHSFDGGPPVLWETMVFGGKHDQYQARYRSQKEALRGHTRAVFMVRESKSK